jgi:hypothetical protein
MSTAEPQSSKPSFNKITLLILLSITKATIIGESIFVDSTCDFNSSRILYSSNAFLYDINQYFCLLYMSTAEPQSSKPEK